MKSNFDNKNKSFTNLKIEKKNKKKKNPNEIANGKEKNINEIAK